MVLRPGFLPVAAPAALLVALLAAPAAAQIYFEPFAPGDETATVTGAYKRYQTHVLKLSAHRYTVLFQPGYVDFDTAIRAIAPLCAAQGRVAEGEDRVAPVDLLLEDGTPDVQLGIRVACVKSGG